MTGGRVSRYAQTRLPPAITRVSVRLGGSLRLVLTTNHDQTNVKGTMIASKVFLPTARPERAAVVAFTAVVVFPAAQLVNLSGYITSKLAVIKLMEFLAAENPNVFAVALHPGMIETKIFRGSGADPSKLPMDTGKRFHSTRGCVLKLNHDDH